MEAINNYEHHLGIIFEQLGQLNLGRRFEGEGGMEKGTSPVGKREKGIEKRGKDKVQNLPWISLGKQTARTHTNETERFPGLRPSPSPKTPMCIVNI